MRMINVTEFENNGNTDQDLHFTDQDTWFVLTNNITQDALRSIQIFTPDLEPSVYNNQEFINNLLNMSRGNRQAKIQILAMETTSALHQGHLLINLAQQLTSKIEIRIPPEEYQDSSIGFILVDNKAFILRPDSRNTEGIYSAECKFRAQKLSEIFSYAWDQAEIDPQTRRLSI